MLDDLTALALLPRDGLESARRVAKDSGKLARKLERRLARV